MYCPGGGVERVDISRVIGYIETAVVDDRAGITGEDLVIAPDLVGGGDIALAGAVDADDAAQSSIVEIFFAVGGVDLVAGDDDRGVDIAAAELEVPDRLAGADFKCVDSAVGIADDEQAHAADDGDDGDRVGGIERATARGRYLYRLAGLFVEGEVAMAAGRVATPVGTKIADDDQIFVDDGGMDAATITRDTSVFFGQRTRPYHVAVAVKTEEIAADTVGVDIAGFGIID